MSLEIGARLGAYEIVDRLGEGGMGVVYRARDTRLDREVAIKVLPPAFSADPDRLARFEREAKVLAALNHPNIGAIYGLEEFDGSRALVMELVEGPTLDEHLEGGSLPLEATLSIARQIAEALANAHARGIVHRDLKPANIKLAAGGKVKVLDFGLAKATMDDPATLASGALSDSPTLTVAATEAGIILGTAGYMSPEQARGQPVDRRADIWAFGVIVDEMLTGERRFASTTVSDTLAAVLREEIVWHRLPVTTPRPLRRLLRRCLERDPERRLHDLADARLELDDALAGVGEVAAEPPPEARRRPRALALVAGALVAALVGVAAAMLLRTAPSAAEPPRIRQLTFSGDDSYPSVSPDGRLVAFTSTRGGTARIWLRQLAGGGEQPLTDGADILPRFSPDGSSVLFLRSVGESLALFRTALVGGRPRRLLDEISEADWAPDGNRLAVLRVTGSEADIVSELMVFDLATSELRRLARVDNWNYMGVRWSPDGRRIAVVQASSQGATGGSRILLVDPGSGESTALARTRPVSTLSAPVWTSDSRALVYAEAQNSVGDLTGAPARIVVHPIDSAAGRTLFWATGLFPFRGNDLSATRIDIAGPGRLIFDTYEQREALVEIDLAGGEREQTLTRSAAADRQPAYSPDGRRLVFSSNRSGNLDLWTLDRESGELRQLTDDPAQDWDPGFTPDGRSILFSSDRSGNLEIWQINVDGSGARQITRDGVDAENPTQTADGEWIVFSSGNPDRLGVSRIRPDGTDATLLMPGNWVNPEVSPDGRYALYVQTDFQSLSSVVRVVEVATGTDVPFQIDVAYRPMAPNVTYGRGRWLPDGTGIVFICLDQRGRTGVCAQQFVPGQDTSASRRQLGGFWDHEHVESLGLSPDGNRLTVAVMREVHTLQLAEGVPGIE